MFILRLMRSERALMNDYEVKLTVRVTKEMNERLKSGLLVQVLLVAISSEEALIIA